jgi:hypothetical protein
VEFPLVKPTIPPISELELPVNVPFVEAQRVIVPLALKPQMPPIREVSPPVNVPFSEVQPVIVPS